MKPAPTLLVAAVQFDTDAGGAQVTYLAPDTDVLDNGLVLSHTVMVPPTDEFDGALAALEQAALSFVRAVQPALGHAVTPLPAAAQDDTPGPYDEPGYPGAGQ